LQHDEYPDQPSYDIKLVKSVTIAFTKMGVTLQDTEHVLLAKHSQLLSLVLHAYGVLCLSTALSCI